MIAIILRRMWAFAKSCSFVNNSYSYESWCLTCITLEIITSLRLALNTSIYLRFIYFSLDNQLTILNPCALKNHSFFKIQRHTNKNLITNGMNHFNISYVGHCNLGNSSNIIHLTSARKLNWHPHPLFLYGMISCRNESWEYFWT